MKYRVLIACMLPLMLTACGDTRVERAGSGAVIGAATGFAVGAVCCMDPPHGMLVGTYVGAAVGAITGAVISSPLFFNHESAYWPYDMKQQ